MKTKTHRVHENFWRTIKNLEATLLVAKDDTEDYTREIQLLMRVLNLSTMVTIVKHNGSYVKEFWFALEDDPNDAANAYFDICARAQMYIDNKMICGAV